MAEAGHVTSCSPLIGCSAAAETAATSAATSPPQHYHSSYSRHAPYPHPHQDSFSPHHNNNHTFGGGGGGDTANNNAGAGAGARAGELPPLVRAGDKAGAGAGQLAVVKGEAEQGAEQRSAQYMSANCVIFTYYSGDISKMVDEHFTKALSQASDRGEMIIQFAKGSVNSHVSSNSARLKH